MYGGGAQAYGNAAGANGVAGLQQATNDFRNSGQYGVYGVGLQEGLQALNRTHAAAGNLSSGNADTDAMKYATDQAGKAYGSYAAGLAPYLQLQGQGALASTTGQANAATGLASGLNASYMGQGGAANATQTGIGNNNAGAELNNYKVGGNILGAITGLGGLAMGGLGGMGGVGGLTKGLGGLFGSFGPDTSSTGDWYGRSSVGGAPLS